MGASRPRATKNVRRRFGHVSPEEEPLGVRGHSLRQIHGLREEAQALERLEDDEETQRGAPAAGRISRQIDLSRGGCVELGQFLGRGARIVPGVGGALDQRQLWVSPEIVGTRRCRDGSSLGHTTTSVRNPSSMAPPSPTPT